MRRHLPPCVTPLGLQPIIDRLFLQELQRIGAESHTRHSKVLASRRAPYIRPTACMQNQRGALRSRLDVLGHRGLAHVLPCRLTSTDVSFDTRVPPMVSGEGRTFRSKGLSAALRNSLVPTLVAARRACAPRPRTTRAALEVVFSRFDRARARPARPGVAWMRRRMSLQRILGAQAGVAHVPGGVRGGRDRQEEMLEQE